MKPKFLFVTFLASLLTLSSCNISKPNVDNNTDNDIHENDNNTDGNSDIIETPDEDGTPGTGPDINNQPDAGGDNGNNNQPDNGGDNGNTGPDAGGDNGNSNKPVEERVQYSENKTWIVDGNDTLVKRTERGATMSPFIRYTDKYFFNGNEGEWICAYVDGKLPHPIENEVSITNNLVNPVEITKIYVEHNKTITNLPKYELPNYALDGFTLNGTKIDINTYHVIEDISLAVSWKKVCIETTISDLCLEFKMTRLNEGYVSSYLNKFVKVRGTVVRKTPYNLYISDISNGSVNGTITCYDGSLYDYNGDAELVKTNAYVEMIAKFTIDKKYGAELINFDATSEIKLITSAENNKEHEYKRSTYSASSLYYLIYDEPIQFGYKHENLDIVCSESLVIKNIVEELNYYSLYLNTPTNSLNAPIHFKTYKTFHTGSFRVGNVVKISGLVNLRSTHTDTTTSGFVFGFEDTDISVVSAN